ncbi:MAG TPA: CHAD domain-containing protein [Kofleriaceae bacterium]|nr:CHAD domain-containing protein [Kofleriaceae bacterium]
MTSIIPEQDRLGPLATPAPAAASPAYGDPVALRAVVLAAVKDALEPARSARSRAGARPAAAVHDVRKAIRRTRALVDLLSHTLPRRERKDLLKALVGARRSLGPARDLAVASDTLVDVARAPEIAPAAAAIVAAARADAPSLDSVADDVNRAIDVALAQGEALAAALPDEVDARDLVRSLAGTYRRARRARKKAKRSDRAVHRWRRRTKELSYQLSVFADVGAAEELREGLSRLDDELGAVVDRLMLKDFVGLYGHAAAADAVGTLLAQVDDELIAKRDSACKGSKDLFATRPRKLRKRLVKALAPKSEEHNVPEEIDVAKGSGATL